MPRFEDAFRECELIINPSRYPQYVRVLRRILKRVNIAMVSESRDRAHFMDLVGEFCRGPNRHLLVWGGDGTAHAAINALMECLPESRGRGKSIGFLRGGTGNGIQDSYDVPVRISRQLTTYAESMSRGYVIDVDLLSVGDGESKRFGQLLGVGFDVEALRRRERYSRRGRVGGLAGFLNYAQAGLHTFFRRDFRTGFPLEIELLDGKYAFRGTRVNAEFPFERVRRTVNPMMLEVGTRPYYGKLFKVCPDVVCNDGNMDLYLFNFRRKSSIARHLPALWYGHHRRINKHLSRHGGGVIERFELRRMRIEAEGPLDYHVDGELLRAPAASSGRSRLDIGVEPHVVSFIVPGRFYRLFHPFEAEETTPPATG